MNNRGRTCLHLASERGELPAIEALVAAGADCDTPDPAGQDQDFLVGISDSYSYHESTDSDFAEVKVSISILERQACCSFATFMHLQGTFRFGMQLRVDVLRLCATSLSETARSAVTTRSLSVFSQPQGRTSVTLFFLHWRRSIFTLSKFLQ